MKLKFIFILLVLFFSPRLYSHMEFGSDFIFSGFFAGVEGNELLFKSHNYFFIGSKNFSLGPMYYYESKARKGSDTIAGAGLKIGNPWYLLISGGYYRRHVKDYSFDTTAGGMGVILQIGKNITSNIRISISSIGKYIGENENLTKRWRFDTSPYIGIKWEI